MVSLLSAWQIGPQATKLKVCLYEEGPGGKEELVGQGSYSLVQLLDRGDDDPGTLQSVAIPLVNQIGKGLGQVQCSLRYFHSRTPGEACQAAGAWEQPACFWRPLW